MKENRILRDVEKYVKSYLNTHVTSPCVQMLRNDPHCHLRVVSILSRVRYLSEQILRYGCEVDKAHLSSLSRDELERRVQVLTDFIESENTETNHEANGYLMTGSSQKHLIAYVSREFNWVIVSIMSASYISALVLTRSVFELLVGVATRMEGGMKDRVDKITFLEASERKQILKLWNRLCGWGHPYGRWVKEICPIYIQHEPFFHSRLCGLCLDELCNVLDLYAVTALSKYEIPIDPQCLPMQDPTGILAGLGMLSRRLENGNTKKANKPDADDG
ncbi:hypothetical protein Despr_0234 [Desulfobulbus propionicus DSM 2032]|uniref:Uncharacterized protein n=1 Tax=Desulfobulbus propionicus (strain ATCC 33891 / DSM 2032 / VKM B-1956 / 1pr3) TaxID=577650 RepID=A0A7U4DMX5_DESPD|nr:hypothetical protein [Desulfobulbus propionicus]ADW16421.1 hypothetical protein Despr_0234 [Desulfobulbus propionicus DSM 2032]